MSEPTYILAHFPGESKVITLDAVVRAFLEATYQKIRLLRSTEKSKVWLAADRAGQTVIIKRLAVTGLPLAALQKAVCPKLLYYAEDAEDTLIVEEHIPGESLEDLSAREKFPDPPGPPPSQGFAQYRHCEACQGYGGL